jgi:hypothetical protein
MDRPGGDGFRLRPPRLSENDVEKICLDILQLHYKVLPVRLHSGRYRSMDDRRVITSGIKLGGSGSTAGTPDYIVPLFFVETKAEGGRLSREQRLMHQYLLEGWGRETIVADGREALEAGVEDWLKRHGRDDLR